MSNDCGDEKYIREILQSKLNGIRGLVNMIVYDYLWWEFHCIFVWYGNEMLEIKCNLEQDTVLSLLQKVAKQTRLPVEKIELYKGPYDVTLYSRMWLANETLAQRNIAYASTFSLLILI